MTIVCTTNMTATRVIGVLIQHGLRPGQGYVRTGPTGRDPHTYLTLNIPPDEGTLCRLRPSLDAVDGASIR
jgi:hypothetical protein